MIGEVRSSTIRQQPRWFSDLSVFKTVGTKKSHCSLTGSVWATSSEWKDSFTCHIVWNPIELSCTSVILLNWPKKTWQLIDAVVGILGSTHFGNQVHFKGRKSENNPDNNGEQKTQVFIGPADAHSSQFDR